jgi:CheY-like chemotaxis protein
MAKILVVEDDLDLVETYTDLLEAHQHTVVAVSRAAEAIQLITRVKPAVIVLDLNLPGDSGVVVINFVRGYLPLAKTKIIIATGHPEIIQRSGYLAQRTDVILSKPISNEQLLATIDGLLGLPIM